MEGRIDVRVKPLALAIGPREAMSRLVGHGRFALLESALPMAGQAEWSYIAGPAVATLYTDAAGSWLVRDGRTDIAGSDPFDALRGALAPDTPLHVDTPADLPPGLGFVGGWVGLLGYDAARHLHPATRWPARARDDTGLPLMAWLGVDQVLAHHHPSGRWWQATARGGRARDWPWAPQGRPRGWAQTLRRLRQPGPAAGGFRAGPPVSGLSRTDFEAAVQTLRRRIAAGDLMQANLSRRVDAWFDGDPWSLYAALADANPAPFCAYLDAPGFALASCSPERFLRVHDGRVQARPIKGTAPRGAGAAADAVRRDWLAGSAKNRAEHLMIVDLMRNDLGRVARTGSVRVPVPFALEAHASVWQMVSTVEAVLRPGTTAIDLLRACWPPGSMTGAPKLAAIQAIEDLEPTRRGAYAGAIGYLDCRGGLDLSVVIRTAVLARGRVGVQLGGAIVAESDPAEEWAETVAKGRLLLGALARGKVS